MKRSSSKISYNKCRNVWDWIIQISLWLTAIILIIYASVTNNKKTLMYESITFGPLLFGFFLILYIIYIINNIAFSNTFKFLYNQAKSDTLYKVLQSFVQKSPELVFIIECEREEADAQNNSLTLQNVMNESDENLPKMTRVVTFTDQKKFKYYCWRDVSGCFEIDGKKFKEDQKFYINLTLKEDIDFADPITHLDYKTQKDEFIQKNRFKDIKFDQNETKRSSEKMQNQLIKLNEETPKSVKWYYYVVFVAICFAELYKIYIVYFTIKQTFTIKKLISSRNNLKEEDYKDNSPSLNIFGKVFTFENTFKVNNKLKVKSPTKEEIEKANEYVDSIKEESKEDEYKIDIEPKNSINDDGDNPLAENNQITTQLI